jgi:hypothetical protein
MKTVPLSEKFILLLLHVNKILVALVTSIL